MRTDRAVSTPLAYVLNLAIVMVLITGLIVGGTSFVNGNRESVVRTELRVIGQQIAADVQQADRLVEARTSSESPKVSIRQRYPDRVAGSPYTVTIEKVGSPARQYVNLTTPAPAPVSVAVRVPTETAVLEGSSVNGGLIEVQFADTDAASGKDALVIQHAD